MIEQISSFAGALLALSAYIILSKGLIHPKGWIFNTMNLIAGLMLLSAAITTVNYGFILLNAFWMLIACTNIFWLVKNKNGYIS